MNTFDDFIELLCDELSMDKTEIQPNFLFRELRNWSSLNALLIISRIHEVSGKLISPAELATAKTVQDFYTLLK
jgi:acyl carrier protein